MCATCGCSPAHDHSHDHPHDHAHDHGKRRLEARILGRNDLMAGANRRYFAEHRVLALNLVSSPGAGKTTLLERTLRELGGTTPFTVIEGDQETDADARRIRATGCRVVQLNTGTGCHLDAAMIERAVGQLAPPPDSVLFIENVGNLVCPALFDLGEHAKVLVASVTEGEDKPLKYPHMFRAASLVLLNKVDLLPYLPFDSAAFIANVQLVNPRLRTIPISATAAQGLADWYGWLRRGGHHGDE